MPPRQDHGRPVPGIVYLTTTPSVAVVVVVPAVAVAWRIAYCVPWSSEMLTVYGRLVGVRATY